MIGFDPHVIKKGSEALHRMADSLEALSWAAVTHVENQYGIKKPSRNPGKESGRAHH